MDSFSNRAEPWLIPALIALVGLCAFGLGRLSVSPTDTPRLVINAPGTPAATQVAGVAAAAAPQAAPAGQGAYVASKSGTKYYLPGCSGAARIKEENKVWFVSSAAAEAAGYGKAANCPGL